MGRCRRCMLLWRCSLCASPRLIVQSFYGLQDKFKLIIEHVDFLRPINDTIQAVSALPLWSTGLRPVNILDMIIIHVVFK